MIFPRFLKKRNGINEWFIYIWNWFKMDIVTLHRRLQMKGHEFQSMNNLDDCQSIQIDQRLSVQMIASFVQVRELNSANSNDLLKLTQHCNCQCQRLCVWWICLRCLVTKLNRTNDISHISLSFNGMLAKMNFNKNEAENVLNGLDVKSVSYIFVCFFS